MLIVEAEYEIAFGGLDVTLSPIGQVLLDKTSLVLMNALIGIKVLCIVAEEQRHEALFLVSQLYIVGDPLKFYGLVDIVSYIRAPLVYMKVQHFYVTFLPLPNTLLNCLHDFILELRHCVGHLFLECCVLGASFEVFLKKL